MTNSSPRVSRYLLPRCLLAVLVLALPAQAFQLSPPLRDFEEERQIAITQHAQILEQFGGEYDDPELAAYVTSVGERVAAHSSMADKPFVFTVLNSPIVNAFTVGGGYVYVTRGILGSINSEAELAALLGHEIAHVTERHGAEREAQMKRDRLATIGVGLLTRSLTAAILTDAVGSVAGQSYSRRQEAQSDYVGVQYITASGYDPYAMADMLGALEREIGLMQTMAAASGGGGGLSVPAWLQDHPQTDDRIRDTTRQADRIGIERGSRNSRRQAHLDAIDGLIVGQNPNTGAIRDGRFVHTGIGIAFDFPKSYEPTEVPGAFAGVREDGTTMLFSGAVWPGDRSLEEYALSAWYSVTEGGSGGLDSVRQTVVNGLPAVTARKRIERFGSVLNILSISFRVSDEQVLGFAFLAPGPVDRPTADEFKAIAESFTVLDDAQRAAIKPYRIRIVTAGAGDTVAALAKRAAYRSFAEARLRALNGIEGELSPGDKVKLVVLE